MVKKKSILREDMLKGALNYIQIHGIEGFTARSIANFLNISTQPIYLEFESITKFKDVIFSDFYQYLQDDILSVKRHEDPVINLCLNYIYFATNETKLHDSFFLSKEALSNGILEFQYNIWRSAINSHPILRQATINQTNAIFRGTWINSIGISNLINSNSLSPSESEIVTLLQHCIQEAIDLHKTTD